VGEARDLAGLELEASALLEFAQQAQAAVRAEQIVMVHVGCTSIQPEPSGGGSRAA
jgi:hypothetical protein